MMGRAVSDDNAEQPDQQRFREGRTLKSAAFSRFATLFNQPREIAMNIATHPFDALMEITARPPAVFVRGEGSYLWDDTGKRYLDFIQGWAVTCLGHAPAVVADAIAAQAKLLITPSPAYYNDTSLKLAKALVDNSCFDQVFFTNSGAEANEGAIKLARKYGKLHKGGAFEIITFEGGFHGRTLATMSASGKKAFEPLFEPKVPGFKKAKLNDLASVKALINDNTVAVMLEPIQGEAGVWPASDQFLQQLRALTDAHGLLLIFDEIQTGMGRTGKLFHYEHTGIAPDIMTLGKGIGGGVPLAALLATERAACFEHGDQGGTFNGNPIMCAA